MARHKTIAVRVPQTKEQCALVIAKMSNHELEINLIETAASEKISELESEAEIEVAPIRAAHEALRQSVESYSAANRSILLTKRAKSFKFTTGVIGWRKGSVSLKVDPDKEASILAQLKKRGLTACYKITKKITTAGFKNFSDDVMEEFDGLERIVGPETFYVKPNEALIDTAPEPKSEVA